MKSETRAPYILLYITLGLSIMSLLIAILAYNRSGDNLDQSIVKVLSEIRFDIEINKTLGQTKKALDGLHNSWQQEGTSQATLQKLHQIQENLNAVYATAPNDILEEQTEINQLFETLTHNLENNSPQVSSLFTQLIDLLQATIDTHNN